MSSSNLLPVRLVQTIGITTSLLLTGASLTLSTVLVPRLLESPATLLLRQWDHAFQTGKRVAPPLGLLSAFSFFYLAYLSRGAHDAALVRSYTTSGLLSLSIVPYTIALMGSTNRMLLEKVDDVRMLREGEEVTEVGLPQGQSAHQLVDRWGVLNLGRAGLTLASGLLGLWTALS